MKIELNEEISAIVSSLAVDMGLTEDEVVEKIIQWFLEDSKK